MSTRSTEELWHWLYERAEEAAVRGLSESEAQEAVRCAYSSVEADRDAKADRDPKDRKRSTCHPRAAERSADAESPTHDGSRFIWRDKDCTTYGGLGSALCGLNSTEDAADFWNAYVEFLSRPTAYLGGRTAHEVAGANIGYLMGYYSPEERQRVYGLFPQASHPIFGYDFGRGDAGPCWGNAAIDPHWRPHG